MDLHWHADLRSLFQSHSQVVRLLLRRGCRRRSLGVDHFRDGVVAGRLGGADGIAHLVVAVQPAGRNAVCGEDARTLDLSALHTAFEFEDGSIVVAARLYGCKPRFEELTHAVNRLLSEVAVGRPIDKVTVNVDKARHHGHSGAVDLDAPARHACGSARRNGYDLAVLDNDRAFFDHLSIADDDASIRDDEVLRRRGRGGEACYEQSRNYRDWAHAAGLPLVVVEFKGAVF